MTRQQILGAIVAIVSSFGEKEVSLSDVFMAEIGLGGELRRINNVNLRLKEAGRAGFKRCFIPEGNLKEVDKSFNFKIEGFSSVKEVIEKVLR